MDFMQVGYGNVSVINVIFNQSLYQVNWLMVMRIWNLIKLLFPLSELTYHCDIIFCIFRSRLHVTLVGDRPTDESDYSFRRLLGNISKISLSKCYEYAKININEYVGVPRVV